MKRSFNVDVRYDLGDIGIAVTRDYLPRKELHYDRTWRTPSQIYTVRQRRGARRRVLPSCTVQQPGASFEVNVIRFSLLSSLLFLSSPLLSCTG